MKKEEKKRHILGYVIGIFIFVFILPFIIYMLPQIESGFLDISIIDSFKIRIVISTLLFIVGSVFAIWSNIDLFRIGKGGPTDIFNIEISPRTKRLVVSGPYSHSRNPMVFGVNSIYFAIAVFLNSSVSILFCLIYFIVIVLYLKLTEEKRLLKDFGQEYIEYKNNVSMIIPFPKKYYKKLIQGSKSLVLIN